ncbi:MAG: helix-turn-helix domain-containing protein [Actinomycetia bacterium]|nr:helix-turn-helix domain-containing protein [Actinomycetes bacterium]
MSQKLFADTPNTPGAAALRRALERRTDLTPNAKRLWWWLWTFQAQADARARTAGQRRGRLWMSVRYMATELALSESTIRRRIRELSNQGLLLVVHRTHRRGDPDTCLYRLRWAPAPDSAEETPSPSPLPPIREPERDEESGLAESGIVATSADTTPPAMLTPPPRGTDNPVTQAGQAFAGSESAQINSRTLREVDQPTHAAALKPATKQSPSVVVLQEAINISTDPLTLLPPNLLSRLRRQGHQDEVIARITAWALSAPAHHPARPRRVWAWIQQGVKERWTDPPAWVETLLAAFERRQAQERAAREARERAAKEQADADRTKGLWEEVTQVLARGGPEAAALEAEAERLARVAGGPLAVAVYRQNGGMRRAWLIQAYAQKQSAGAS